MAVGRVICYPGIRTRIGKGKRERKKSRRNRKETKKVGRGAGGIKHRTRKENKYEEKWQQMSCQYPKARGCQHPQAFRQTADTFKDSYLFVSFCSVLCRKLAWRGPVYLCLLLDSTSRMRKTSRHER